MNLEELVAPPAQPSRRYRLRPLSSFKPKPITYLLPGRIPFGAITIVAGRPGTGKSQLTLALAAQLSKARVATIFLGAEDGLADTVRPRVMAAEGDADYVHIFDMEEGMAQLPTDVPFIAEAVRETGAGLVIIDPVQAHLAPEVNAQVDSSLRRATAPLAQMAQDTGVAVIFVTHLRKSTEGSALDRIGGSGGLAGASRSALLFGKDKDADPWDDRRYAVHIKSNGAAFASPLECRIEGYDVRFDDLVIPTSRVLMEREVTDITWRDLE